MTRASRKGLPRLLHGKKNDRIYQVWNSMMTRCNNPSRQNFSHYGGRGIKVCDRWHTFAEFYADMGDPPPGKSIDRIDVNGNYEPGNCRWATLEEQALNRTNHRFVEVDGEKMPVAVASRRYGVSSTTLLERLNRGWSDEKAAKHPVRHMPPRSEWGAKK